jgi:hypothetical protein
MSNGFESSSKKKWFYPLIYFFLILLNSIVPHYTSTGYSWAESGEVVKSVLSVSLKPYLPLAPIFHIATVVLLIAIWRYGNKVRRIFSLYIGVNYIFIALAQGIGTIEKYGLVIMTGCVITYILVGLLWIWETISPRNDVTFRKLPAVRYWPVPLAFLAFWFPIGKDLTPNFDPVLLLTSPYGLAYCLTTPLIVCLLTLFHPRVNEPLYKITAFVGVIYGIWNMFSFFSPHARWLGVLHFPLLFISIYALFLPRMVKEKPFSKNMFGDVLVS